MIHKTSFAPHTLQHLTDHRVFPAPLPDAAYDKMLKDYAALTDIDVSSISYQSDGFTVTGIAAMPKTITPGTHPILIYNRGGSGEYGKLTLVNVLRSMAPFAQKGFLVFASNYRGNGGSQGKDEFGGGDLHDIVTLLALAEQEPAWDRKNRFMLGHSRGGMMTYMAIKNGITLNAAIVLAGIADAHEMTKDTGLEERVLKARIPDYAANPRKALDERSAISWPEKITVPLLLIHGDNDKDVSLSQSEALDKLLTAPHLLHIVKGGNHAMYRQWDEVLKICFDWLEKYRR